MKAEVLDRRNWLALASLGAVLILGLFYTGSPELRGVDTAADAFSAKRARAHLEVIAREPHLIGSDANRRVKDYLTDNLATLGLTIENQTRVQVYILSTCRIAARVENVAARIVRNAEEPAILFCAHHDSVSSVSGAGDNGLAVAALLESARALSQDETLTRDIIFLFTDGEELRQFGARAFVAEHPWAQDVGMIVNIDGRGNKGQPQIVQTSQSHSRAMRFLTGSAGPAAAGTSLALVPLFVNSKRRNYFAGHNARNLLEYKWKSGTSS